tara:strand:- start:1674 stop:2636 length:963 start_codon:yes stop_codon:yes gene_type:complete
MNSSVIEKKKRGRKKQSVVITVSNEDNKNTPTSDDTKPLPKKRGRKPKGGKIIQHDPISLNIKENETNIVLHLKCSLNDIHNTTNSTYNLYDNNNNNNSIKSFNYHNNNNNCLINDDNNIYNENNSDTEIINNNDKIDKNHIWTKINKLKINLHNNNICDKRSACFWCTYEFDNPPIYIPQNEFKDTYQVYGCFCSPECSAAYLLNEKIDSSIKFERYQLLNHVYGKMYNYTKNIKPAPNPHYLLDKYYGSLSIKEYRNLFKNDQLLIIVDKPLTHVFPELYEDNSDFILNQRTIPNNTTYKLKRKNDNKITKVIDSLKN